MDPGCADIANVPDGDRITIRELARMQSGLYPYTSNQDLINEAYGNPQRSFTPEQLLELSFSHPLDFRPGTNWEYDNTNYVLMGLVVEKLSGRPLSEYFEDHIFRPFGLGHTILPPILRDVGTVRSHVPPHRRARQVLRSRFRRMISCCA